MYELIMQIINKSILDKEDIGVAYDEIAVDIGRTEELKKAYKFLRQHYIIITTLNKHNLSDEIKELCENENPNDYAKLLREKYAI